jgi:carboxylate-amine ligase
MLGYLRPALEDSGDWDEIARLTRALLADGSSTRRQRLVFQRSGSLSSVVDHLLEESQRY